MNLQKRILLAVVLLMIGGTGFAVTWFRANQRLGKPGLKATPLPGTVVMKFDLPEKVLDFTSTNLPTAEEALNYLPQDTSYAQRLYHEADTNWSPEGFWVSANVILMGTDRSSIHKPEYCLPGHGWQIQNKAEVQLTIQAPEPYQMPVAKWTVGRAEKAADGSMRQISGLYVFWFVADNEQTVQNNERQWWMTRDLLRTGVLQRWAYVSYFVQCWPGQEDAAFERLSRLISASVPEFQWPPRPAASSAVARR